MIEVVCFIISLSLSSNKYVQVQVEDSIDLQVPDALHRTTPEFRFPFQQVPRQELRHEGVAHLMSIHAGVFLQ